MNTVSQYVAKTLYNEGIISNENIDICRYGIEYFIILVIEILSVIILSAFIGNAIVTIVYFGAFIPLRIYSGGYHAKTKIRCYLILLIVYAVFTSVVELLPLEHYMIINVVSVVLTGVSVWRFAPIAHVNKHFNEYEKTFYRKVSIRIMLVESIIIILGRILFKENKYVLSFSLGQLSVGLSMLTVFVKNIMIGGVKNEKNKNIF